MTTDKFLTYIYIYSLARIHKTLSRHHCLLLAMNLIRLLLAMNLIRMITTQYIISKMGSNVQKFATLWTFSSSNIKDYVYGTSNKSCLNITFWSRPHLTSHVPAASTHTKFPPFPGFYFQIYWISADNSSQISLHFMGCSVG